jgi:hypothetical protein
MFKIFKILINSSKKSSKLKSVSKKLSQPVDISDMDRLLTHYSEKDKNIEKLIDIAESDEYVRVVMNDYGANRQTLKEIYGKLTLIGAGQYIKGHYVAASSLVYPLTLKFLLEHFDGKEFTIYDWDSNNSLMFIANRLIEYFEKGEVGEVE